MQKSEEKNSFRLLELEMADLERFWRKTPLSPLGVKNRVVIPGVRRPFGGRTGQAGGRPCPLRLIWTGRGTVDRGITVPNLLYCSNFSYYFPPTWSRGGWQFEVAAYGSVPAPVWPFYLPWTVGQCPFDPYRAGAKVYRAYRAGGRPRRAARPTDNPG
jgi:hypothetical protein